MPNVNFNEPDNVVIERSPAERITTPGRYQALTTFGDGGYAFAYQVGIGDDE